MRWLYISSVRQIKIVTSKLMTYDCQKEKNCDIHVINLDPTMYPQKILLGLVALLIFYFLLLMRPNSKQVY